MLRQNLGFNPNGLTSFGTDIFHATPVANNTHLNGVLWDWGEANFLKLNPLNTATYTFATHTTRYGNLNTVVAVLDSTGQLMAFTGLGNQGGTTYNDDVNGNATLGLAIVDAGDTTNASLLGIDQATGTPFSMDSRLQGVVLQGGQTYYVVVA